MATGPGWLSRRLLICFTPRPRRTLRPNLPKHACHAPFQGGAPRSGPQPRRLRRGWDRGARRLEGRIVRCAKGPQCCRRRGRPAGPPVHPATRFGARAELAIAPSIRAARRPAPYAFPVGASWGRGLAGAVPHHSRRRGAKAAVANGTRRPPCGRRKLLEPLTRAGSARSASSRRGRGRGGARTLQRRSRAHVLRAGARRRALRMCCRRQRRSRAARGGTSAQGAAEWRTRRKHPRSRPWAIRASAGSRRSARPRLRCLGSHSSRYTAAGCPIHLCG